MSSRFAARSAPSNAARFTSPTQPDVIPSTLDATAADALVGRAFAGVVVDAGDRGLAASPEPERPAKDQVASDTDTSARTAATATIFLRPQMASPGMV